MSPTRHHNDNGGERKRSEPLLLSQPQLSKSLQTALAMPLLFSRISLSSGDARATIAA